jgi:hypothetical protein
MLSLGCRNSELDILVEEKQREQDEMKRHVMSIT